MNKFFSVSILGFVILLSGCATANSEQRQKAYELQMQARIADEKAREASKAAGIKYESPNQEDGFITKIAKNTIKTVVPISSLVLDD